MIAELAERLRASGVRVGTGEVLAAHRALLVVDLPDARTALRAVLCSSRGDLAAFDAAWTELAAGRVDPLLDELMHTAKLALPRTAVPSTERAPQEPGDVEPVPAAYSAVELLLQKDFSDYTEDERAAARALLERIARRAPRRRSRRTVGVRRRRGEVHDLRATVRASLRHGGEPVELHYRAPSQRPRPMVLLIDVSGSMAPYARMLLQYAQAAVTARRRVEVFAFGTRLTRITRELAGRDVDRALRRATDAVVDLGGGTRIGDSLGTLNREHGRRLGRGSDVVVLSDGWDRGEPEVLAAEMARLRRCAHRMVWLNPLAADPRYEPLTRGMRAALPHTDSLIAGNSIASLAALADLLETP